MERKKVFAEWASQQMCYDIDKAHLVFAKIGSGCGKDLWTFIAKRVISVRNKCLLEASVVFGSQQQQEGDTNSDELKELHQKKQHLIGGIQHLDKKASAIISAVSARENEVENLRFQYRTLLHKKFLLEQHFNHNERTYEKFLEIQDDAVKYINEINHRRNSTGIPQLLMLGDSSPLRETHIYLNVTKSVKSLAKQLRDHLDGTREDFDIEILGMDADIEAEAGNMMMNYSVEDILQSINSNARSTMEQLDTDCESSLVVAEKEVAVAKKALKGCFQKLRDDFIKECFKSQERKQILEASNRKIKEALMQHDEKLKCILSSDVLDLRKSLVRLELKRCEYSEMIEFLKPMVNVKSDPEQTNELRAVAVMHRDNVLQEKTLMLKYQNVMDLANCKMKLFRCIKEYQEKFQKLQESCHTLYETKTDPLFLDAENNINAEIELIAKLPLEKLLSTEIRQKHVSVRGLSLHRQNVPFVKSILTALHVQTFYAAEVLLPKWSEMYLGLRDTDSFLKSQSVMENAMKEEIANRLTHLQNYSEYLQHNVEDQQTHLIPFICKHISRTDADIDAFQSIEDNVLSCYNWDPKY